MSESKLRERLSELESVNHQLLSELAYIDELLRAVGFSQGILSAKGAAEEILSEKVLQERDG